MSGILRFDSTEAWSFLPEGRPFSVFTLFKPETALVATITQRRAVVWCIGSPGQPPALNLEWDSQTKASKAVVSARDASPQSVVATAPDSHPANAWRVVFLGTESEEQLAISINGGTVSRVAMPTSPGDADGTNSSCTLQVGGAESQRDALFFGAITELIIFDRGLTAPSA